MTCQARKLPRDRVERNEYGVVCVVGYRKVAVGGTVRIGGKQYGSPRLMQYHGETVFLSPHNCYGDYQASPVDSGRWEAIELQEVADS